MKSLVEPTLGIKYGPQISTPSVTVAVCSYGRSGMWGLSRPWLLMYPQRGEKRERETLPFFWDARDSSRKLTDGDLEYGLKNEDW